MGGRCCRALLALVDATHPAPRVLTFPSERYRRITGCAGIPAYSVAPTDGGGLCDTAYELANGRTTAQRRQVG